MLCVAVALNHWQRNWELTGMVCDLKLENVLLNGLFDCKCQYLNIVMAAACCTSRDSHFWWVPLIIQVSHFLKIKWYANKKNYELAQSPPTHQPMLSMFAHCTPLTLTHSCYYLLLSPEAGWTQVQRCQTLQGAFAGGSVTQQLCHTLENKLIFPSSGIGCQANSSCGFAIAR